MNEAPLGSQLGNSSARDLLSQRARDLLSMARAQHADGYPAADRPSQPCESVHLAMMLVSVHALNRDVRFIWRRC